jgi:ubiquinone/menaquinone biosynthesis C-methylase UbiE
VRADEAIEFLRPALAAAEGETWADFGAGMGTFTEALAVLLGEAGTVIAVDNDDRALRALSRVAAASPRENAARVVVAAGDFRELQAIPEINEHRLDGALFANALHFVRAPEEVLARVAGSLTANGRIIVIEYDRTRANRWVPYPMSAERLVDVARAAGLGEPRVVARRPSAYHREMYCALLRREEE